MKCRACIFGLVSVLFLLLTTGCQSLFLSKDSATVSAWTNWNQVTIAFNNINPNHTTVKDLNKMGFNPLTTPNIKIMPYVDIIPVFMPNPNIHYQDLPIGVKLYVEAKENTTAYLVELENVKDKRHGNLFLDIFGFKRLTHQSGWRFKGLILIKDQTVVYTLASGEPDISREDSNIKPLGPFQELDAFGGSIVGMCH
jgi:hypothetical protein